MSASVSSVPLWFILPVLAAILVTLGLRLVLLERQPLWADEVFSVAIATGHSLEHAAEKADPSLGDYVEAQQPVTPAFYRAYLQLDDPPAEMNRVVRAVFLSDTNPPLYYVLLSWWMRPFGSGDGSLRMFSLVWAVACFPLLWLIGRELGGTGAGLVVCLLFALAPASLYYSTEGRMYSQLWFFALGMMWTTLRMMSDTSRDREGAGGAGKLAAEAASPVSVGLWVLFAVGGMLTHYFFIFVFASCGLWLLLVPGRLHRGWAIGAGAVVVVLLLPWYLRVPETLANWRVTQEWLTWRPWGFNFFTAALALPWSYFSPRGVWGVRGMFDAAAGVVFVAAAVLVWRRMRWGIFRGQLGLLWLVVAASCLGVIVFDLWRGTYATAVPRYAIAGLPAAMLLVGVGLSRLELRQAGVMLLLIAVVWSVGIRRIIINPDRASEPFDRIAAHLDEHAGQADLIIVHSIPSGVLGVARYMQSELPITSWVGQLGHRRMPHDLELLIAGRGGVFLVNVHPVGEPLIQKDWLDAHATLAGEVHLGASSIYHFTPRGAERFADPESAAPAQ